LDGEPPVIWGTSILGVGCYHYRYDSGREGTGPLVGFWPRKANLVVYLVGGAPDRYPKLLEQLGPHKLGKGCLYLGRLDDVDLDVLRAWSSGRFECTAAPTGEPAAALDGADTRSDAPNVVGWCDQPTPGPGR
jgi:hypothetical protein